LFGAKNCGGCYMVELNEASKTSTVVAHAEYEKYEKHVKRIEAAKTVVEAAELRDLHLDAIKIVKATVPVAKTDLVRRCGG
jgi:hypothetical protein